MKIEIFSEVDVKKIKDEVILQLERRREEGKRGEVKNLPPYHLCQLLS